MNYYQILVTPIFNGHFHSESARQFCFYADDQKEANDKAYEYAHTLSDTHSIVWLDESIGGKLLGTRLPHGLYNQLSQSRHRNAESNQVLCGVS